MSHATVLSVDEAKQIAVRAFPRAPEHIADRLGVAVEYCAGLTTRLGWCAQFIGRVKIRINATQPAGRQRFTLAHELAHVLLGTEGEPLGLSATLFASDRQEERDADQLAAEMLLPIDHLKPRLGSPPLDHRMLRRIAAGGGVTEDMVACRVANLADELGVGPAAVVRYATDGKFKSFYSPSLRLGNSERPQNLLSDYRNAGQKLWRKPRHDGSVLVVFQVGDPQFPKLFIQLLPPEHAAAPSQSERTAELRKKLFGGNASAEASFGACIGPFCKSIRKGLQVPDPVQAFLDRHRDKPWAPALSATDGRELIKLYLARL